MLPRLTIVSASLAVFLLLLSPSTTLGGNALGARQCPLTLSSTVSGDQWQIACADGVQASSTGATFDASQLKVVRVSSTVTAVTLTPENTTLPTEVVVPGALSKVSVLVSSSLKSFSLEGAAGASVEIDAKTFTKMTALRSLSITAVNITISTGRLELQPTLNELTIQRAGLVDLKVKVVQGVGLNLTKLDLGFNRLRHLPLAIFASRRLVTANLVGNELVALRLSRRKLRRFLRLVALKRVLVGAIADFQEACADGERKTVQVANRSVVVCQVPKEDDDDLVVDDDGDDTAEDTTTTTTPKNNSSSASSTSEEVAQTPSSADAALADPASQTVRTPPSESTSPTPSSATSPQAVLSCTTSCLLVATAALML